MELTHTHNDFLPDEVMLALTQPSELVSKSLVPSREKSLAITTVSLLLLSSSTTSLTCQIGLSTATY